MGQICTIQMSWLWCCASVMPICVVSTSLSAILWTVAKKERTDHKCLWQRKKDQTTNAGGKRKMAALIRQANSWHQMKETKQLKPLQNPKRLPTCKHKVETKKNTTKSQQSNRLLSATKEWTTTVIRLQSKNNCANDRHMVLTPH